MFFGGCQNKNSINGGSSSVFKGIEGGELSTCVPHQWYILCTCRPEAEIEPALPMTWCRPPNYYWQHPVHECLRKPRYWRDARGTLLQASPSGVGCLAIVLQEFGRRWFCLTPRGPLNKKACANCCWMIAFLCGCNMPPAQLHSQNSAVCIFVPKQ